MQRFLRYFFLLPEKINIKNNIVDCLINRSSLFFISCKFFISLIYFGSFSNSLFKSSFLILFFALICEYNQAKSTDKQLVSY